MRYPAAKNSAVGFFLKLFYKKLIGTGKQFPVDIFYRFAVIVQPVLGKLNRKAMKRTLVQAGYKTLNNLPGKQFKIGQLPYMLIVTEYRHNARYKL
jgi:hypothetical protein